MSSKKCTHHKQLTFENRLPLPGQLAGYSWLKQSNCCRCPSVHIISQHHRQTARPSWLSIISHTHTHTYTPPLRASLADIITPSGKERHRSSSVDLRSSARQDNLQPAQFLAAQVNGHNGADINSRIWEHQYFPSTETAVFKLDAAAVAVDTRASIHLLKLFFTTSSQLLTHTAPL